MNISTQQERNKFVSFWLWLGTIINVFFTIVYSLLLFSSRGLWSATPEPTWLRIIRFLQSIILITGYAMLIKWKKSGFYILIAMSVLSIILNLFTNEITLASFSPIVSIILLYFVLQLKKKDIAYWDAMDME